MRNIIAALDTETQGLGGKFILACVKTDTNKKTLTFHNKNKLWNWIIQTGTKEAKRGKVLSVYAHNHSYDFYQYANLNDPNIKMFSEQPFIYAYCQNNKEIIKFLDTMALMRMSLQKVGETIGTPKKEMPTKLMKEKGKYTKQELKEIQQYCENDTNICLQAVTKIKNKIQELGIQVKRMYTINQIAINYLIRKLQETPKTEEYFFWNKTQGITLRTLRNEEIHSAYKGGRVQAFQLGKHENTTYIDCNSLYPYCAMNMRFPNLRTERKVWKPKTEEVLNKIGISRAMIKNNTNELGILMIRTPEQGGYTLKKGQTGIGTWTHQEINKAIQEGHELITIEWSVTYEQATENPLKQITQELYKLRTQANDPFDKYFYKSLMNCSYGKLGQHRNGQELVIDDVDKIKEYEQKTYKAIKGIGTTNYLFKKDVIKPTKRYYAPIIPCLINADARIKMYDELKKIPTTDLLYTDTDSILFTGNHLNKYKISPEMGDFKIEENQQTVTIWGKKGYTINKQIKISGINTKNTTTEELEKGLVKQQKMMTIKTAKNIKQAGKFITQTRDLQKQKQDNQESTAILDEQKTLIDQDIQNIEHFLPHLKNTETFIN